ncbi:urotensin-2 receptor-like [Petromyzon marinus]|uniref:Urotensin-2 receptor n=1 Tax=Petromyzon marinus TaxID=7757 RepID=A0AAJ7TRT8_PETMA|nr:urotensin-2 receptor-like [Petromyzon marinus]
MWDILNTTSFTTTTTTSSTTNNFWSPAHDLTTLLNWSSTATPDASSTTSSSSSSSSTPSSSDAVATAVMATVLSLLCVVGVSGNVYTLLVLRLLSRRRGSRRASGCPGGSPSSGTAGSVYCFVLNLALADLAYLSTVPFVVCTNVARTWFFGDAGCRLLFGVDFVTMHAIIFLLTAMSAERYAAVARPLRHYAGGRCAASSRRGWAVALLVWALSLAAAAPNMVMVNLGELRLRGGGVARICVPSWSPGAFRCYITVLFVTSVVAPGLIIGCLYVRLAVKYWRSQTATAVASVRSPRVKVLYMILAIVVVFWACFLPFWAWQLANLYFRDRLGISRKAVSYINHAVTCLTYGNSCVNPFLYTLLTKKYKEFLARRRTPRGAAGAGRALGGSGGSTSSHDAPCRNVRISSRRSTMTSA